MKAILNKIKNNKGDMVEEIIDIPETYDRNNPFETCGFTLHSNWFITEIEESSFRVAEKILKTLETQKFEDWFKTQLDAYICGTMEGVPPSKEEILAQIIKIFKL